jgi:hypothetical protein
MTARCRRRVGVIQFVGGNSEKVRRSNAGERDRIVLCRIDFKGREGLRNAVAIYLPLWRNPNPDTHDLRDPEIGQKILKEVNNLTSQAKEVQSHDEHDPDKLDHVTIRRSVFAHKGEWRRFSEEQERSMEQPKENPS